MDSVTAVPIPKYFSLVHLRHLPEGKPKLVKRDGVRFACIRRGRQVDVLEDRCPHEGHPLSMGSVREGVLTCPWHNWKFELSSGRCLFGGEGVRRYPSEILGDEVFVDLHLDAVEEQRRLSDDMASAVLEGSVEGALREGLRLVAATGTQISPWVILARLAATRTPYGNGPSVVALASALSLVDAAVLTPTQALAAAAQAVADEVRARRARPLPPPRRGTLADRDEFLLDLLEERRSDALGRVLGLDAGGEDLVAALAEHWLLPFTVLKMWDRGASLVRLDATRALGARLPAAEGRVLAAGMTTALAWAVADTDLPGWRATRRGLMDAPRIAPGDRPCSDEETLEQALLESEPKAVAAVLHALREGVSASALVPRLQRAALVRLAHYDHGWSRRLGSDVTALEPARAVLFAAALGRLAPRAQLAAPLVVMGAGVLGRLGKLCAQRSWTAAPSAGGGAHVASLWGRGDARGLHAVIEGAESEASVACLAQLAKLGALAPRCSWAGRGRAVAVAEALLHLGVRSPALARLAGHGLVAALLEEGHDSLFRIADNADTFMRDGRPPEGL